jgi:hypothetical protein
MIELAINKSTHKRINKLVKTKDVKTASMIELAINNKQINA